MSRINVLITGINGFIGRTFAHSLRNEGLNIYGLDINPPENINNSNLSDFFLADLAKEFKINARFDYVFHLAALNQTHIEKTDYESYHRINVSGTENLIKGVEFDCFVFMSTAKVYKLTGEKITESSPLQPEANYEKSKLEAEISCNRCIKNKRLVILRAVNIVGPGQAKKAIIPVFFHNALNHKPIEVFAPKKSVLQLLYFEDVISAFRLIIQKNDAEGVFNLSSKDNIRLENLARKIVMMTNSDSRIILSNKRKTRFSEIVSTKANNILGWEAKTGINEILYKYYLNILNEKQ